MSDQPQPEPAFHLDQSIDLIEYLQALLRHKFKILIGATLGAILIFGLTLIMENKYGAPILVAININEEPGGVSPSNYRGSDTLGLLEHDFIIDAANAHSNEVERMIASMRSMRFTTIFIEEQDLLPYLFRENWDPETKDWIDGEVPDPRLAIRAFNGIRTMSLDDDTGFLTVYFNTNNPQLSARLANAYVLAFNKFMKDKQSAVIASRRDFLNKRLKEVDNIELHRSIFRMIETQLAAESLLHARQDYPLEVIEPALPPLNKNSPKRKQWAALAFFGFTFMGIMIVIASVLLKKLRKGLAAYQANNPALRLTPAKKLPPKQDADPSSDSTEAFTSEPFDEWIDD